MLFVIPGENPLGKYQAVPAQVIRADGGWLNLIPSTTTTLGAVLRAG
jgi:hypothetical protein